MRGRRWLWVVLTLVLVIGAFAARYVSLGPGGTHKFDVGGEVRSLPLMSPTILGWVTPGDPTRIESAQYSPDGQWLYLSATRGVGDQLASVTLSSPSPGVLIVDARLITYPIPAARSAIGILFGTRVRLEHFWYEGHPPITMDASTGDPVVVDSYIP